MRATTILTLNFIRFAQLLPPPSLSIIKCASLRSAQGLGLFYFPQPHAKPLWTAYLADFELRYSGSKMERLRELYERCLEKCPPEHSSAFFVPYANLEEKYGLAKRALLVYERAATTVPDAEKLAAYQLYIDKAEAFFGATKTRVIYEAAIEALQDSDASKMCLRYCDLEVRLGEIERGRAALAFGAQMVDPRRDPVYWGKWHDFEVANGNEETFREMLRVKRSVSAAFSTVNYNAAEMGGETKAYTNAEAMAKISREENIGEGEEVMGGNTQEQMGGKGGMEGFVSSKAAEGGMEGNSKKRKAEPNSIEDLERQATRIKAAVGGDDDEIDLDE